MVGDRGIAKRVCDIGVCCNVLGMDGMGVKTRVLFERSFLFQSFLR